LVLLTLTACSKDETPAEPASVAEAPAEALAEEAPAAEPAAANAPAAGDLADWQYYGYKIVHHMGVSVGHLKEHGFNKFDHPPIANHESFVITPALDHFYSKAIVDVRQGPVVVETAAKDERYSSFQVFDHEHFSIFDQVTSPKGDRFVIVHESYDGELPKGTVVKTKANFPFVFLRTQSFALNDDKKADEIRRGATVKGTVGAVELPDPKDTLALLKWSADNAVPYGATKPLVGKARADYTPAVHQQTFEHLKAFLAAGGVSGNVGMFESQGHPAGGSHKLRAAGTLLGHLGFPVHHAYYQQIPVDGTGKRLRGDNGPFVLSLPHDPGVAHFWSLTRYGAETFLPLDPADIGGSGIHSYNALNTKPDEQGMVRVTCSSEDPQDGSYWLPVKSSGYYLIARYYGPTPKLNGNTAKDLVYGGTPLANKFESVKF
jgi:hypothetical protein